LFTLDCNSRTETTVGHPKYQKTQDCNLVSNKNFSEILQSNSLGPGEVGQGGLKSSTYDGI